MKEYRAHDRWTSNCEIGSEKILEETEEGNSEIQEHEEAKRVYEKG